MGLREKVTITLVIIALTQIACRHCMPRTPRKASLKRYLNDLKPVKNNPVPTPYSPSRVYKKPKQTFGKTAQNGRISQNSLPNKSLYNTYNFPENEYPLDNSPRDPFHIGMNFNENNHVSTLQKARNLQSSAISDLKKEMKMKRKLLTNKQVNYGNSQLKTGMSSIKFASNPNPIRLLDSETFPEVQYPLNTMDTWGPNYWNYLPFTQEKSFQGFGQQTFNPKAKEDINKPLTRLTKAKASKYLQSYEKLKEEHRRTSTENSKRSNVGQKGLNFTKTATCEKVSDDFMTASLVSNISSNSTEMKNALISSAKITTGSENTCPVTEYPYHPMPIPYKVIEENTDNICPAHEPKNNTKALQDVDNSVIAQTLQLIQEILLNDDTSSTVLTGNYSKEMEKNMNTSDYTVGSTNKDLSTTLMDSAKNFSVSPTEELSQEISDEAHVGNLRNNMTSLPAELIPVNTTTVAGPLDVRMSIPFSEPITCEALTNALNPGPTPSNGNAVPGSTSIIIIPFNNNAVGKSQMFGTSPDTPIIVYLPSTQSSDNHSQPWPFNQIVSSSIDRPMPNNQLYNVLSNMAPLQNDDHFPTTLASELLNSNLESGSSLPIHETLPTNSMSNNNESSPSSMKEKPISDILIDKSLIDDTSFVITTSDEIFSEHPTETVDLEVNTDTLPLISNFEHPLFDFSGSDFTSLSHGPYNNILHNELPIIAREIDSDHLILNVSSKDLFIPTQNVSSEHLHKITSMDSVSEDSLSEISNDIPPVALGKNFSSVTPTDSIEILKTNSLLHESIPSLPMDTLTESLPQPIDKILLSTTLIEPPTAKLLQPKATSPSPTLLSETLSDNFPITMDTKLPLTSVSDTTLDSPQQHISLSPSPPILNSSPMKTDMTLKTELYKMKQILDKMLSAETPTYNQPPPIDSILLPISASDSLLLPIKDTPTETLPVPAVDKTLLPLPVTDSPIDRLRLVHETLPPISVDETLMDTLPLLGHKLVIPNKLLETGTPSLLIDETVPRTLVSESSADNKPYVLDNLVTPLTEPVTLRTTDTPDNGLSHKIDDMPLKMDLKFPNIYDVSSDDLSLLVDVLPTKIHPEHTANPGVSTYDIPTQVVETLTPVSEVPVSDLPKPTHVLSLPVDDVLGGASPDVPTDNVKKLMSGSIDKLLQDFSSSKVPSDGLPTLPMNVLKLSIHETFPDSQLNEISSEGPPQKDHLPQSVRKLIPDLSLADALTNEPPLKNYSPSHVIDKNIEFPYSTTFHTDTKHLPLVVEHLLSPETDVTPDSLVTDISNAVSLSTNLEVQQFTNLDKTTDEVVLESTPSDLARDNLPLPEDKILSLTDNKPNDLSLPINKTTSTSKLPLTKAFLENVLSDITKGGLSSVVAKALPVTSHSLLEKTLHHEDVKASLSETKDIPLRPVEKIFPNSEHTDNLTEYIPFSKKLVDTSITDLPSELLLLPMQEMHKDKAYIPTDDIEDRDKHETQSLDNPSHDLPVPINKVSLLKDSTKTSSSSKLPITKVLLENVLSDINTKGFPVPVAQSLLVTSPSVLEKTLYHVECPISHITKDSPLQSVEKILPNTLLSDHQTDNLPISTEDTLPLPIDKTYSELQSLNTPTELTSPIDNIGPDIPNISMYDKEQDEMENPFTENLTDDLSSASPMEGIISLSKDTPSDLTLPNNKKPSSSKLLITKVFLENVLSDINTKGFPVPVAQSLVVTSPSVLEKTLYHVECPISHITKDCPSQSVEKILPNTLLSDDQTDNLPISTEDTLPLPINKTYSELQSLNTPRELTSPIDNIRPDIPNISIDDKEQDEIQNRSSENLTDGLSSALPMEGIISLSKDTPSDLTLPNNKIPSSSKLPITKALLENVLSDINTRGFSVPVAQSFPVTSPSVLDKTLYHVESPISHISEDSPSLPVEKILLKTLLSDHPTDNLPISTEDILPLPIDKTYSELQSLNIPTELSSPIDNIRPDIPNISIYDKEQDEMENPSSENLTDDLLSASPMEGIISHSKDTPSDLTLPNNKIPSSSKLPITKVLLENVLSDINTKGFPVPVAQSLLVTSPSVLEKTLYHVECPISHITKDCPSQSVEKILPNTLLSDDQTDNLPISTEDTLPLPINKTYSELQSLNTPTELTSPIDNIRPDIPNISIYDKEQDEIQNRSSENLTDDLSSALPMEGILSLSKDTPSDLTLTNDKTPSSSKLPITKALLENVLSDINTRGLSLPVAKALPVAPRSQLDKMLYFLESPVSDMTKKSSVIPIDNFPPSGINEDVSPRPTDKTLPDNPILDIPTDELLMDKIHNSDILTDDVKDRDKSDNMTDNVEDRDTSDNLTDNVEDDDEDKSEIWSDDVETIEKSDNLIDDIENRGISSNLTDDVEDEDISGTLTDDIEDRGISSNLTDDVEDEDISGNLTDDVKDEDISDNLPDDGEDRYMFDNLTDDMEIEDLNEYLFSNDRIDDIPSDLPLPRTKPYLTSRIPITKALLEKVLSDITDGGIHP